MDEITVNLNVNLTINGQAAEGGSADSLTIRAIILYLFGFVGMFIMLFSIPSHLIFMGILAFLLYLSPLLMVILALILKPIVKNKEYSFFEKDDEPITYHLVRLLSGGGGILKKIIKNFIAPFAFVLFNIFIGSFWILYSNGSTTEVTLISFIIPCAYAMYYYPFILIRNSIKRKNKLLLIFAILTIVGSFAVYLCFYNQFMETNSVVGLGVLQSMLTILGTITILISNLCYSKRKSRPLIIFLIYIVLMGAIAFLSFGIMPKNNEESYNQAIEYIENEEYRKAREILIDLFNYKDSEDIYNSIKFKNLEVGEVVHMGEQAKKPDSLKNVGLTWTVIKVENGEALLLSDVILTSLASNSLSSWQKNNNVRNELSRMEHFFTEEELSRIKTHTYEININGNIFSVSDKLFILSKEELLEYCTDTQIFNKKDSSYNDHLVLDYQMADFDYEYFYTYYVRDVNDDGEWIIVDCENKEFITINNKYVGIKPAMYIQID
ncbi:MAG: hypothetical protein IKC22_06240 [Bacilli bacterium]|nr:hypothetical protein [Bacilli bacterium]